MSKLVVIIQCDAVQKRCSGIACTNSFYDRTGTFTEYGEDTKYMTMTCGGCCGISVASKLEDLKRRMARSKMEDEVVVHLASCIVSDNYHNPPCPHKEYIKAIVERKGYPVVLGSYISKGTTRGREAGKYQEF